MSAPKVYQINEFPNSRYKFDIIDNYENGKACTKTWKQIFEEEKFKGAIGILNLGYFNMTTGAYASGIKIHGEWLCKPDYTAYGICIDKDGNAFVGTGHEDNAYSYSEALPTFSLDGKASNRDQTWSSNGTTTIGFKDGNVVCMLCDKDNGQSSAEQISAMEEYGCQTIFRYDGSWSSHGVLGFGKVVQPSQMRKDRPYLVIYDKEYEAPMSNKKLTLDPYGVDNDENTFAICDELKSYLETYEGIEVMITRYRDNPTLDSSLRADQSNQWGANLVFSINVDGSGTVEGTTVAWTSNQSSGAYKFASLILQKMKDAGLTVSSVPAVLSNDPILRETTACAALALFVGDYSTEVNRFKAIKICAKAICEQLGITYNELPEPEVEPETPKDPDDPNNDYTEEERVIFRDLKSKGYIPEKAKMGEVIRYGELAMIISKILENTSTSEDNVPDENPSVDKQPDDDDEEPALTIDEEYLKSMIDNILTNKGITKDTIAELVSNAVEEYMKTYNLNDKIIAVNKTCFEVVVEALGKVDSTNS